MCVQYRGFQDFILMTDLKSPQHIFVQFRDQGGAKVGNAISIPIESTPYQLEGILNQFLQNVRTFHPISIEKLRMKLYRFPFLQEIQR